MIELKIKDNVYLKQLEKFGFIYTPGEDWHIYFDNIGLSLGDKRELCIDLNDNDFSDVELLQLINLLFDLITEGIVEKIESENKDEC